MDKFVASFRSRVRECFPVPLRPRFFLATVSSRSMCVLLER
jgi:hypothetical protein